MPPRTPGRARAPTPPPPSCTAPPSRAGRSYSAASTSRPAAPDQARTAVFYSISNGQRGLAGVSFGNFLIKQVVEEISRELTRLSTYVTLSPVPGFAAWLQRERASESSVLSAEDRAALEGL